MEEQFGISVDLFDPYLLFKRKKSWSLVRNHSHIHRAALLKVDRVGLKAFRQVGPYLKPTTRMIQIFGKQATRRRVELEHHELVHFLEGNPVERPLPVEPGYVILSWKQESILGMGLYINGTLRSQIPRRELQRIHAP